MYYLVCQTQDSVVGESFPNLGSGLRMDTTQVCSCIHRFAPLLQKNATLEDPSRVIVTASVAGLGVGSLGENATFGYSASKGTFQPSSL